MTTETETTQIPPDEAATVPSQDWRHALAEELRDHPALSGFEDVGALAREHVHLQKLIGRKGIVPPGEDATPEDHERFFAALGRPAQPDGYQLDDIERPEELPWSSEIEAKMLERMHAAGLTNTQARALVSGYVELQAQNWAAARAEQGRTVETAMAELRTEWGQAFDAKLDLANRAFAMAFGDHVGDVRGMRLADGSFLGDHPDLVRGFAMIGGVMAEAEFAESGVMSGSLSRDQARLQLSELERDANARAALLDRGHPDHKQTLLRRSRLAGLAYGDAAEDVADLRL